MLTILAEYFYVANFAILNCSGRNLQLTVQVHNRLGIRTNTVTVTPLCDSLNVPILSSQYGYRDTLWYGYRDRLGICTTVSTLLLPRPPLCTVIETCADTETPEHSL